MSRSLAVVCDELHITNLENVLHETVGEYCVEQWINMSPPEFYAQQEKLSENDRLLLRNFVSEFVEVLPRD